MAVTISELEAQVGKNANQVDAADKSIISKSGVTMVVTEAERIASPLYTDTFEPLGAVRPGDVIPISDGGTGATDSSGALVALGAAAESHGSTHWAGQTDPIPLDALAPPDNLLDTSLHATTGQHGLMTQLDGTATHYFNGQGDWASISLDDLLPGADTTINDATTTEHGLLPKLDGTTTNFMRGDGTWAVPPGTGGGGGTAVANDVIWDTAGDLVVGTGANAAAKLVKGANGTVLSVVGGSVVWAAPTAASVATDSIWDTAGDLAVGTGSNTAAKVPIGSNGQVLTVVGGAVTWATPSGGGGTGNPYSGAIIVASSEAPSAVKTAAHYTCDGTDDEVQINAAMLDASALTAHGGTAGAEQAGTVLLTGGRFNIGSDPIKMRTGCQLQGMGRLTELRAVGLTTAADDSGSGTGTAIIKLNDATVHNCTVRDLYLQGNAASGGDGHGIHFASTSGADRTAYPNSNPDPYIHIDNLYIEGFTGSANRHGIWMDTDLRGSIITKCELRNFTGHGIYIDGTPDSNIVDCHVGGAAGTGFYIAGGNVKLSSCKSFYCDTNGFYISSGRGNLVGCESQDNAVGFRITGSPVTFAGVVADTHRDDAIIINASRTVIAGLNIFQRASGRYATCTRGLTWTGTPTDCSVVGVVNPTDITSATSGTATGARNFVRVSNGSSLVSVG